VEGIGQGGRFLFFVSHGFIDRRRWVAEPPTRFALLDKPAVAPGTLLKNVSTGTLNTGTSGPDWQTKIKTHGQP
jgi:hypothetical protein